MNTEVIKCKRCSRRLKKPEHQAIGYGPVCLKKLGMARPVREAVIKIRCSDKDCQKILTEKEFRESNIICLKPYCKTHFPSAQLELPESADDLRKRLITEGADQQ